jgi:FkbH-like protein
LTTTTETLPWLPSPPADWAKALKNLNLASAGAGAALQGLALPSLNLNQLSSLSKRIELSFADGGKMAPLSSLRLAVFSNGTISFAAQAIPASALRHGVATQVRFVEYERVTSVALEGDPDIAAFDPDVILLAFDHRGLPFGTMRAGEPVSAVVEEVISYLRQLRDGIKRHFRAPVIFQTLATPPSSMFGSFDLRVGGTWRATIAAVNGAIADLAADGDYVLDVAGLAERVGAERWFDDVQWLAHKVPFRLTMIPAYGDHVGRLIGAIRGRSRKCLVLDLDNTLWGGAIGDDGLSGIVLGQGSPEGEAYLAVQQTALALRDRGIILAVSSKNDEANARLPFQKHPDMVLREEHIAVFQANWVDKCTNLEAIAKTLNIGLDALVLLDDNPAERGQVRMALPAVAVPELDGDPSTFAWTLLSAGYFEAVSFLAEDRRRADEYAAESRRVAVLQRAQNFGDYLSDLQMVINFAPFDSMGRSRISQLINKSNQFNLTTKRYTEAQVAELEAAPSVHTLQVRLKDRFGDSGMIAVLIARPSERLGEPALDIDSWLMSCRVLGRKVEEAMLHELVLAARAASVRWIIGRYIPTPKNGMVKEHYAKLGFEAGPIRMEGAVEEMTWLLDVTNYYAPEIPMRIERHRAS